MSGFCVLGAWCSVFDRQAKVAGLSYTRPLCPGCHSRASVEINLLRYDYVDLTNALPLSDRRGEVQIFRPKPESRAPMDLEVFSLRTEIVHAVVRAATVAGWRSNAAGVREGFALDVAANALKARLDDLAAVGVTEGWWNSRTGLTEALSGPQVLMLLGSLHRRARRLTGVDAPILRIPGDCPGCCASALRRREDNPEWIWCASCGAQLTRSRYQQLLHHVGA